MRKMREVAVAAILLLSPAVAQAQSSPNLTTGQVPTAAQWNSYFAAKQNVLGYTPINKAGDVMLGRLVTAAPGATTAGFNLTPGSTPSAPANGDLWTTTSGIFARINGATVALTGSGSGSFAATAPLAVSFPSSVVTYALNHDANFTVTGSNLALAATLNVGVLNASGAITGSANLSLGAANTFSFTGRSSMQSPSDGILTLISTGGSGFLRLQLGGGTTLFPAIKRNATAVQIRLADDSGDAPFTAAAGTFSGQVSWPGTSGGVPYFSNATTVASSAALTANLPVIGGGAGAAPSVGTRSGNTTAFVTTTGAQTSGNCVSIDASGNHVAFGAACGTISAATSGQLAYYTGTTTISGDTFANVSSGDLTLGGTGTVGGSLGLLGLTSGKVTQSAQAITGTVAIVWGTTSGTPAISVPSPLSLSTTTGAATWAGLTSGGVLYASGTTSVASSGALTANLPVIGGGAGVAPSVGTRSGNTTAFVTTTGTQTSGNCVSIDANGNHIASGGVCFSAGSGAALTRVDDTNVTLTLGGSPTTALVNAASITVGWSGILSMTRGGSAKALTASNGGIVYTDADSMEILAGTATSGLFLLSGASAAPSWSPNARINPATPGLLELGNVTGPVTGGLLMYGQTSGNVILAPPAVAGSSLMTLPAATDTLVGKATTDVFTNKTFNTAGTGNAFSINGTAVTTVVPATVGGTGLASGTSGGILGFTGTTTIASSGLLASGGVVLGGGGGATPLTNTNLTFVSNVLTVGVGTASQVVINNNGATLPGPAASSNLYIGGNGSNRIWLDVFAGANQYISRRANTSSAAPSALVSGDLIFNFGASGYGVTGYVAGASRATFNAFAAENWTDTANGTYLTWTATKLTTASPAEVMRLDGATHLGFTGTAPGISACGTSPGTASGTDTAGRVTAGTLAAGCVITFNIPYQTTNYCSVSSQTQLAAFSYTYSLSAITVTQTSTTGNVLTWVCAGI